MPFLEGPDPKAPSKIRTQGVNEDGHALIEAVSAGLLEHVSKESGLAFSFTSIDTPSGGEEILAVQNISGDQVFHVTDVLVGGATSSEFQIHVENVAPGGTSLNGVNLSTASGETTSGRALAKGNNAVTGLTPVAGTQIAVSSFLADTTTEITLQAAVIISQDQTIYITLITGTTSRTWATILGVFEGK